MPEGACEDAWSSLKVMPGGSSKPGNANVSLRTTQPNQECPETYFMENYLKLPIGAEPRQKLKKKKLENISQSSINCLSLESCITIKIFLL